MNGHPDIKRAVLRGVYEDNVGIPRSSVGNGRSRSVPAFVVDDRQPGSRFKAVVITLIGVVVILGINLQLSFVGGGVGATGPVAMQVNSDRAARLTVPHPDIWASLKGEIVRDIGLPETFEPLKSIETAAGATSPYDALLSQLGVPMADLFGLKVQTIVIDPGHGGIDPGATGHQGLREKDVALDIAKRLHDKLTKSGGYRVLLTREGDEKVYLKERVAFAKQHHADLFISIHANSLPVESVNYVETYYFGPHSDKSSLELAEKENQGSDYAMGDFREIIAKIGDTLKTEESKGLATAIHKHLYSNMKRRNGELVDAGTKTGPFMVLLGVEVPSVLVEVSCISNKAEETRLSTPGYRDSIAGFLKQGIVEYLDRRTDKSTIAGRERQYVAKHQR